MKENVNGYIYLLTDKRNGKQYVGKHTGIDKNYFSSGYLPNKIAKKYGKEVFDRIILEDNITDDETLSTKEILYIKKYNTFNGGYNLTEGGEGGNSWMDKKTVEEKMRISKIKREKNLGRTFSLETLEKMSRAKKGIPLTDEHKKNISKSQSGENHPWFGRQHSQETKLKISEKRKGVKNPKHSDFMRKNNPNNLSISINGRIFDSIQQAADILNISRNVIKRKINSDNYPEWVKIKKL
jgi:group I intron endonuclease